MIKLAVDLDDCLLNTSRLILDRINQYFSKSIKLEEVVSFHIEKLFNLNAEVVDMIVQECLSTIIRPNRYAVEALNFLSDFYDICFITNRRSTQYQSTKTNLEVLGFKFKYDFYLCNKDSRGIPAKAELLNKLGIEFIIEDRPDTIEDIYNRTNCNILVMDKPWNRNIAENGRICIDRDWMEIKQVLMDIVLLGDV